MAAAPSSARPRSGAEPRAELCFHLNIERGISLELLQLLTGMRVAGFAVNSLERPKQHLFCFILKAVSFFSSKKMKAVARNVTVQIARTAVNYFLITEN